MLNRVDVLEKLVCVEKFFKNNMQILMELKDNVDLVMSTRSVVLRLEQKIFDHRHFIKEPFSEFD